MSDEISKKVATRFIEATPLVVEDVPPKHDWGWASREDPRMHLQSRLPENGENYKVWLEEKGRRTFIPVALHFNRWQATFEEEKLAGRPPEVNLNQLSRAKPIPVKRTKETDKYDTMSSKIEDAIRAHVAHSREAIENRWVQLMLDKDWLSYEVYDGTKVIITAYPTYPTKFSRTIDILTFYPAILRHVQEPLKVGLDRGAAGLAVGHEDDPRRRNTIPFRTILWEGEG
jgi:hypothetical protein